MLNIKIKKIKPLALVPTRANPSDAGADLYAIEEHSIPPMKRSIIPTGIKVELPDGHYGRIAPRSSLAAKNGIDVLAGVIDSSYRGEVKVVLLNTDTEETINIKPGDRIAQLIIEKHYNLEFVEEELTNTDRGEGGFGSSGK